jgi:hypothetical protein
MAALATVAGGAFWLLRCPCGTVTGFVLRGDLHETPVTDWRFANDVPLCQIQIAIGWRPHSVNVNCMATPSGDLYLSCSFGERKYWCPQVTDDHPGRLRLQGIVDPVVLSREVAPTRLDEAWRARVRKLQNPSVLAVQPAGVAPPPDAPRPDSWWSFRVRSASAR